jgi:hypothetical protein
MRSFKQFVQEGGGVLSVTPTKDTIDIKKPETVLEINANLARQLSNPNRKFRNPQEAIVVIRRVLETYGIALPHIDLKIGGESYTHIKQFGQEETEHFLCINCFGGVSECVVSAYISTEEQLNKVY